MSTVKFAGALALVLGMASPWCAAQGGDGLSATSASAVWPRWQGRLSVGLDRADGLHLGEAPALRRATLLGDYYLTEPFHDGSGGMRATSGLIVSPKGQMSQPLPATLAGHGFNVERRLGAPAGDAGGLENRTAPYVGLGYTGIVARTGVSFSADLGVVALTPGPKVQFGKAGIGSAVNAEDVAREWRLSPVLSLGVSYAF